MNRRTLERMRVAPEALLIYAPVDDPRALERVVEILARLVTRRRGR